MLTTANDSSRFFAYSNGNGFARYDALNDRFGDLWVMGKMESDWVLAGCESVYWVKEMLENGTLWEFSPARLLGSSKSAAKVRASQANGAKGGRPRNPDSKRARRV